MIEVNFYCGWPNCRRHTLTKQFTTIEAFEQFAEYEAELVYCPEHEE